ncbi:type VI secretion system tip protein TssI/VgrG [Neptunomonas phycophila]|uniref:type VI secretion system Vgr family protein n=1 Tax=Neptunomonas phycophila TaxID=1572645 RepID=UPI001BEBD0F1|nr:type VI secretion system tip protein VgrG [Neptunomonas phycophila]MBT3145571.1 type VI secretion system tip protein VgrG [Neptunomonas phycophila]MDO6784469.1 type VI secretion system tip protein TssI/VgrG [Neptunomonas phycophila]
MAVFTQQGRLLAMDSPLGDDVLLLTRLEGEESVSSLFEINIEAYSSRNNIKPIDIVGQNVTLKMAATDENALLVTNEYRYINGYIKSFKQEGQHLHDLRGYSAVVVPWLWFLTQTSDCKIFQFKTVQDIVSSIFKENGFSDFQFRVVGQHPAREYCVQYQESDFDFVSRLLEEEGIYYYFEHSADSHTLVLSDHIGGYGACAEESVSYNAGSQSEHTIHNWYHSFEFMAGRHTHRDFDFKKPSNRLQTSAAANMEVSGVAKYEHYRYPGRYHDKSLGDQFSRIRVEADEAAYNAVNGESGCRSFMAGHSFTLNRHEDSPEEQGEYVLLSVAHTAQDYSFTSNDEQEKSYSNAFRCISSDTIFRPEQKTPWPSMQGPQSAVVVGPAGEEIYTDEYGRVKIQFPWDRYGQHNENSSCWVRISQNWAGRNYGSLVIPRIGQEVIVDFYDGNPDRPIVTGRVYNAEQMPPNQLPSGKTRMTIKTQTHKGTGFNELTFEDEADEEFIYMHAQKNMETHVENSRQSRIEFDDTTSVGNDSNLVVAKNRLETIEGNHDATVKGKQLEKIDGDKGLTVGGDWKNKVGGDLTFKASGNIILDASKITLVAGSAAVVVSGGSVKAIPKMSVGPGGAGGAAVPTTPSVMKAAAGTGSPFVSHCPNADKEAS